MLLFPTTSFPCLTIRLTALNSVARIIKKSYLTLCRAVPDGYSCLAVSRAESDVSFEGKTKGENVLGGGVAIIYRDCWRASKINIQDKLTSFEFLCTRVDVRPTSIIVCKLVSK